MRPAYAAAAALFSLLALPALARAQTPPGSSREVDIDVDAASVGVSLATRVSPRLSWGGGLGVGPSPILGATYATGTHYDATPNVVLLEAGSVQGFARLEILPWLRLEGGLRAGIFFHGRENFTGGQYLAGYAMPTVGWRWFWLGPRVSAGVLRESQAGAAGALTIDLLIARFVLTLGER